MCLILRSKPSACSFSLKENWSRHCILNKISSPFGGLGHLKTNDESPLRHPRRLQSHTHLQSATVFTSALVGSTGRDDAAASHGFWSFFSFFAVQVGTHRREGQRKLRKETEPRFCCQRGESRDLGTEAQFSPWGALNGCAHFVSFFYEVISAFPKTHIKTSACLLLL